MPAFLVELPDRTGFTLLGGSNKFVVFAADAADAKAAVAGFADNDAIDTIAQDSDTTATEIIAAADFDGYELRIAILDSTPVVDVKALGGAGNDAIGTVAINSGGNATYVVGDILTAIGGTFTRAATFRVTSVDTGVIDGIELKDPGEYTVDPSLTANAVTGGGGDSATMDLTMAGENSYEVFMGQMVTLLNAESIIAGADIDFGTGGSTDLLLTVADGGGGDDLGDKDVVAEFRRNGIAVPGILSTVTDGGAANAALSVLMPAVAARVAAQVVAALKA